MDKKTYDRGDIEITWCPGCGNYPLLESLKGALAGLGLDPGEVVVVSGIGQAAKTPHYLRCHMFNGLHGRAVPLATGVKAANRHMTVLAIGGDGDMYGEGGNHFLHAIRRNPDITNLVHNNMVYGLTKGQASPTSPLGMVTPVQVHGVAAEPINPLAVAITVGATFVARAFTGDGEGTVSIIQEAIKHRGYALVDILQPCVTYNRVNTFQWFSERTYHLDESHDPRDMMGALKVAMDRERLALGILYASPGKPTFEDTLPVYARSPEPLHRRRVDRALLGEHIGEKI
ncbi:MAG: 2-oxoacid ferredoxin oxidoreductase [bacterium]|nr:MAG: 2-oxoacid ferredoxin oxidoreductase [bacterium]